MYTIGQLAKRHSLSRSTLIYYDSKGLLKPSGRSGANYRTYSDSDAEKLERIILFRNAGMPLSAIAEIIDQDTDEVESALEARLISINQEIQKLRGQQKVIVDIIKNQGAIENTRIVTKEKWVAMLKAAGLDEDGMKHWHIEFEKTSPEAHQDFLESIGIADAEIAAIRDWSKSAV
ncbi:MAG: MerR family transcriptional regulator [Candidatus Thiodiazotropha sp. (ex Notomyrtea botanica)]|nr:MerR family transcriptional regulator [Candidatus Thiodiazotropha sp. (ex Notomyrtea botanica)]